MNAVAHIRTSRWFSPPKSALRPGTAQKGEESSFFVIGSIVLHLGLLVFVSSRPEAAHASSSSARVLQEIEISILAPETTAQKKMLEAPPTEALPLGRLSAAPNERPRLNRETAPHIEKTTNEQIHDAQDLIPSAALPLLTNSNPYASADVASFTSGSASSQSTMVLAASGAPRSGPQYGVETGSNHFSKKRALALRAWHKKVRAQLSHLASRAYPRRAQKLRQEGTTKITVRISESGRLLSASVTRHSPHASLDRAALSGIQSIERVAPPPTGTGSTSLTIPVSFRLL